MPSSIIDSFLQKKKDLSQQEQSGPTKEPAANEQQPKLFGRDEGYESAALSRKESEIKGNNHLDSGKKLNAVDEVLLAKKEVKEAANTVVNTMSQDQQEELRKQAGRGMRK